jgi:hypothetical protein
MWNHSWVYHTSDRRTITRGQEPPPPRSEEGAALTVSDV